MILNLHDTTLYRSFPSMEDVGYLLTTILMTIFLCVFPGSSSHRDTMENGSRFGGRQRSVRPKPTERARERTGDWTTKGTD